jgi:hypothetical protein
MRPEFYCHLPFLSLSGLARLDVGPESALIGLTFDEWLRMEDPAMAQYDGRYDRVAPLFARTLLPDGNGIGTLTAEQEQAAEDFLDRAHAASILALPLVAAAPPGLSAAYVVWRGLPCDAGYEDGMFGPREHESGPPADDDGLRGARVTVWLQQPADGDDGREQWVVERRFGPAQREWLLSHYDVAPDPVDADAAERLAASLRRLDAADWGVRRFIALPFVDALTALLTRGTPVGEALVLLVSALENLVNPDGDRPLGQVFGIRCAAWFAESAEQRRTDVDLFRAFYDARSRIVHGSDPARGMRKLMRAIDGEGEDDLRAWVRLIGWLAIDWLAGWFGHERGDDSSGATFRARLAAAAELDDEPWAAAWAGLVEGRSRARG